MGRRHQGSRREAGVKGDGNQSSSVTRGSSLVKLGNEPDWMKALDKPQARSIS
jgi:hypothetical protein